MKIPFPVLVVAARWLSEDTMIAQMTDTGRLLATGVKNYEYRSDIPYTLKGYIQSWIDRSDSNRTDRFVLERMVRARRDAEGERERKDFHTKVASGLVDGWADPSYNFQVAGQNQAAPSSKLAQMMQSANQQQMNQITSQYQVYSSSNHQLYGGFNSDQDSML